MQSLSLSIAMVIAILIHTDKSTYEILQSYSQTKYHSSRSNY